MTDTITRFEKEELMPGEVSARSPLQQEWVARAACRTSSLGPDAWFPISNDPKDSEEARLICETRCPVRESCLAAALQSRAIDGIWGGLDREQRRLLMRRNRKRR